MQITITFDPQDLSDVQAFRQMAQGLTNPPQPQVGNNSGSTASGLSLLSPEGSAGNGAAADAASPSPVVKGKPGRKPKDAAARAGEPTPGTSASPTDTSEAAGTSASPSSASESAPPSTNLTLDDVRAKLQAFTVAKGVPEGIALLKKFEAARISELPAEKYADFVVACEVAA